jgi:hypothetical protein
MSANFFLMAKKYNKSHLPIQVLNVIIAAFICAAILVSYQQLLNANSVHSVTATLVEQLAGIDSDNSSQTSIKALTFMIIIAGILLITQTIMISKD